jgi:hypothetical protein
MVRRQWLIRFYPPGASEWMVVIGTSGRKKTSPCRIEDPAFPKVCFMVLDEDHLPQAFV